MKVAFDTSVLVAAAMLQHPHHARARVWTDGAERGTVQGHVCSHALAELYSVLTKLPVAPRVTPKEAETIVARFTKAVTVVSVTAEISGAAIARCVAIRATSGAVFDATHLLAAEAAGAEVVLTFNVSDFTRLSNSNNPRILEPPDPPSLVFPT